MSGRDEWDYGPFKVGDVVEGCGFIYDEWSNGMPAVVSGGLKYRKGIHYSCGDCEGFSYQVEWQDGTTSQVDNGNIRRRKPPMTGLQEILAMFDKQPDRVKETA